MVHLHDTQETEDTGLTSEAHFSEPYLLRTPQTDMDGCPEGVQELVYSSRLLETAPLLL